MRNDAWAYLVVSSGEQADSLPNQRAWAETCARQKGWTISRYFDGVGTGKNGPRKKWDELRVALRRLPASERPGWVLLIRLDRVGRGTNLGAMQTALYELHELGVRVFTREGGEERQDDVMAQLITSVKLAAGAQENAHKIDKAAAYYERAREAQKSDPRIWLSSKPPYGTRCVVPGPPGTPGYLEPQEPEAETVRFIFSRRVQRIGPSQIAKELNKKFGPPTPRNGNISATRWHRDTVQRLLATKDQRGISPYVAAGVVTQEDWDLAQVPINGTGGRRTKLYTYPLGGAIRCECGERMRGNWGGTPKYGRSYYYCCTNRRAQHPKALYWKATDLEQQFADFLHAFATVPALRAIVAERNGDDIKRREELGAELEAARRELATLRTRKGRLMRDLEDEDDDGVRKELRKRLAEYTRSEADFEQQQKDATNELAVLNAQAGNVEERERAMLRADELWSQVSPEERKEVAAAVAVAMHGQLIVDENGVLEAELLGQVAIAKRLARRLSA